MAKLAKRHIANNPPEAELSVKAATRVTRYIAINITIPMIAKTCLEVNFFCIFLEEVFFWEGVFALFELLDIADIVKSFHKNIFITNLIFEYEISLSYQQGRCKLLLENCGKFVL